MAATAFHSTPQKHTGLPVAEKLLDYIERLDRHRKGSRAVRLHLSLLAAQNRRDQHVRAAIGTFEALTRIVDGAVFAIDTSELILVCHGASVLKIDDAVQKIRYLFSEDPLFTDDAGDGAQRFCTWYDLETEFERFRQDARNCIKSSQIRRAAERSKPSRPVSRSDNVTPSARPAGTSLAEYGNLETLLATADISRMIRQQPICALTRDAPPTRVFDEVYVSIGDLQRALAPDRNLTDDRWIFQRLTRTLDRRVLSAWRNGQAGLPSQNVSLNLNVSTLLGPEFEAFDRNLDPGARGTIMIELNVVDIFGDIGAFVFARDFARERGYRVCIDGLTHLTATFVDRTRLDVDMIKIYWSPDITEEPAGKQAEALAASVRQTGAARVVLCRCDDARAVRAGLDLGIALFQGRQIDRMLSTGLSIASAS